MAKLAVVFALLFVGGFAFPVDDEGPGFDEDMSIFFDHTMTDNEGRIVGGTNAANGAYPWMVAMTHGRNNQLLCGASIVSNRVVLTAAHCIVAVASGSNLSLTLRIRVGSNRWASGGTTYTLASFVNHPQYNAHTIKNDIGILRTSSNIVIGTRVRTIPVNYDHIGTNVAVRVSGWGRTRTSGPISDNLLELRTTTFDGQRCVADVARVAASLNMPAPAVNPALEICTFSGANRGTCNGDSGSPLVLNSNNQQIGVVSWGLPCARGAPDMFVRISAVRTWLQPLIR